MTNLCTCSSHDRITCAANLAGTSRLNILLTEAECYCLCHLNEQAKQISAEQWLAERKPQPEKARRER